MKNSDRPAFPLTDGPTFFSLDGLTKREYFSGIALQCIFNSPQWTTTSNEKLVSDALELTDELLKQLGE